jgi:uncharacterized protein YlaI
LCFPCTFVRACYAIESIDHCKIDTKRKAKNPIKAHGWNHHNEDKMEGQRKAKKDAPTARTKEGRYQLSPTEQGTHQLRLMLSSCIFQEYPVPQASPVVITFPWSLPNKNLTHIPQIKFYSP